MMKRSLAIALLAIFALPALASAQESDKNRKAREHYQQAEAYMNAGVYDLAAKEYRKGYKLQPTRHAFLFNIGLAHKNAGEQEKALNAFERFLEKAPNSKRAAEARAHIVALRRAIEAGKKASEGRKKPPKDNSDDNDDDDDELDDDDDDDDTRRVRDNGSQTRVSDNTTRDLELRRPGRFAPQDEDLIEPPSKRNWTLIAVGAALIAAGAAIDLAPSSGSNGDVDLLDFVPVGLYGVGGVLVWRGVF